MNREGERRKTDGRRISTKKDRNNWKLERKGNIFRSQYCGQMSPYRKSSRKEQRKRKLATIGKVSEVDDNWEEIKKKIKRPFKTVTEDDIQNKMGQRKIVVKEKSIEGGR